MSKHYTIVTVITESETTPGTKDQYRNETPATRTVTEYAKFVVREETLAEAITKTSAHLALHL